MNFNIKGFRFTSITSLVCSVLFMIIHIWDYDFFEHFFAFLKRFEKYELDELMIYVPLLLTGIIIDLLRIRADRIRIIEMQDQKLQTMQATMVTVQDIVGNALNGLQGMRIKAEYHDPITPEDIKLFDTIVHETSEKITQLRDMDSVSLKYVATGIVGLDVESK